MNGWFPKINSLNQVASGNDGIFLTNPDNSVVKVSSKGTSPFWIGNKLCYNLNDGRTAVGDEIIDKAYNNYYGSEISRWTGFIAVGEGKVDFYDGINLYNSADKAVTAKYAGYGSIYGFNLVYLAPFQADIRSLVYNNILIANAFIPDYGISLNGNIAWQIAVSTYGREIHSYVGRISIRSDEGIVAVIDYLGQSWLVTQCDVGVMIYPFLSHFGYFLPGDLFYPDARVVGNLLRVVGSSNSGEAKFDNYVDLSKARIDLRLI